MNGLFVVFISGVATVIRETVPEGQRQAQWEILRVATAEDMRDIAPHHYFKGGVLPA